MNPARYDRHPVSRSNRRLVEHPQQAGIFHREIIDMRIDAKNCARLNLLMPRGVDLYHSKVAEWNVASIPVLRL
jgi:hypothetical protein